jgi:predicted O-linked N-acetylglucosamine transferase (SPINDLY family)
VSASTAEALESARADLARGDPRAAMLGLTRALAVDPSDAGLWQQLGRVYLAIGRPDQTRAALERALTLAPEAAAGWHLLGLALHAEARHADAVEALRRGLSSPDAVPQQRIALAATLLDASAAGTALDEAARAARECPADAGAPFVLGTVLAALGRHAEAVDAFARATTIDPGLAQAHHNRALALDELGRAEEALAACDAALAAEPTMHAALSQRVFLQRRIGDWAGLAERSRALLDAVRAGSPGVAPFAFLAEPAGAADQLACARIHAAGVLAGAAPALPPTPPARTGRPPRVGFVSSGFNNHPTALLVAELVERLRATPVAAVGYATTADDGGAMRRRLRAAFASFHEVHALDAAALAERIRADRIDVLVDLRGYGAGEVSACFARRPAPVQVNWLAYPGTSGAPFIDYLLADRHVVPDAQRAHYSEALLRLPHAFQPSDTTRPIAEPPSRAALALPEAGFVFASFNNTYKIGPAVFDAWRRILAGTPGSVLWLLGAGDGAFAGRLRAAAADAGIDPARLVFQPKLAHDAYLALYRHVDLFLDTWPYGAHTTASDALWAGAPLLTLPGETFASRVGLSLLSTLGLPELIAADADDYVARAATIATRDGEAARLRGRLREARGASALFDMPRFARDFARAMAWMHERAQAGLPPADHDLPAA